MVLKSFLLFQKNYMILGSFLYFQKKVLRNIDKKGIVYYKN